MVKANESRRFDRTAQRLERPRHHAVQLRGDLFQDVLSCLRVRNRLGARRDSGSIALLGRLWRRPRGSAYARHLSAAAVTPAGARHCIPL